VRAAPQLNPLAAVFVSNAIHAAPGLERQVPWPPWEVVRRGFALTVAAAASGGSYAHSNRYSALRDEGEEANTEDQELVTSGSTGVGSLVVSRSAAVSDGEVALTSAAMTCVEEEFGSFVGGGFGAVVVLSLWRDRQRQAAFWADMESYYGPTPKRAWSFMEDAHLRGERGVGSVSLAQAPQAQSWDYELPSLEITAEPGPYGKADLTATDDEAVDVGQAVRSVTKDVAKMEWRRRQADKAQRLADKELARVGRECARNARRAAAVIVLRKSCELERQPECDTMQRGSNGVSVSVDLS
jgi:hypothetical protein